MGLCNFKSGPVYDFRKIDVIFFSGMIELYFDMDNNCGISESLNIFTHPWWKRSAHSFSTIS